MRIPLIFLPAAMCLCSACTPLKKPAPTFLNAKTMIQVNNSYDPRIAIAVDAIVVHQHGRGPKSAFLKTSIESWKKKGFPTGRMFFSDSDAGRFYTEGKWDGTPHPEDIERNSEGKDVLCDNRPYMVPTAGWTRFLEEMAGESLDDGAEAILPEEPLAHTQTGYEQSFRELWQQRYGTPWEPENQSPQARAMTSQLKAELYAKLEQHLAAVTKRRDRPFILPIHSAYSNLAGGLIAPLGISLPFHDVDGYIGQVWTGPVNWTMARYNSPDKSFFASAYALYDYFVQLVAGSGKQLWLLTDPVEDNPSHKWEEFEEWYRHCVVAELFCPRADKFEVMPWPDRIFLPGKRTGGGTPAPEAFRISILSVVQALQEMPAGGAWTVPVSEGVGVAVADTLMWERDDPPVQGIYGMLMPLIQAGVPVSACVLERATDPKYLSQFRVIVLSYAVCKPPTAAANQALADWVRRGGSLIVLDKADKLEGPFWWNEAGYDSPLVHLFQQLKLPPGLGDMNLAVDKGHIFRQRISPREFGDTKTAGDIYLPMVDGALKNTGNGLRTPGCFCMRRGPFLIAHAINSVIEFKGNFLDIFDPAMPVLQSVKLTPGTSGLYRDVSNIIFAKRPAILHTSHRLMSQKQNGNHIQAVIRGPSETPAVVRVFTAGKEVESINVHDSQGKELKPDIQTEGPTLRVQFPNDPDGATLELRLK